MATNDELLAAVEQMGAQTDTLASKVVTLTDQTQGLSSYGRKNRKFIRLLVVSVVFDVVLSLGLGWIGITARNAAIEAKAATTASKIAANNLRVICEANNAASAKQTHLWESLFKFPPPPNETTAAREQRERTSIEFKKTLAETFAVQDCEKGAK